MLAVTHRRPGDAADPAVSAPGFSGARRALRRSWFDRVKFFVLLAAVIVAAVAWGNAELELTVGALVAALATVVVHLFAPGSAGPLLLPVPLTPTTGHLTRSGKVLLAYTALVGWPAMLWAINMMYLLLGALVATLLLSWVLSWVSLSRVEVRSSAAGPADKGRRDSRRSPRRSAGGIFAGEPVTVMVELRKRAGRLPAVGLVGSPEKCDVYVAPLADPVADAASSGGRRARPPDGFFVPFIPAGDTALASYAVTFFRRGRHHLPGLKLTTGFPFGLFERSAWYRGQPEVLVYPALGKLRRQPLPSRPRREAYQGRPRAARAGGEEFYGLRAYRPGDNPRHIHWRSTARLRRLLVKELEADRQTTVELVLDACLPGELGEDLFELAVSFATTCLLDYYSREVAIRLRIVGGEPVVRCAERGVRALTPLLSELALVRATREGAAGADGRSAAELRARLAPGDGQAERLVVTVGRGELWGRIAGPETRVVDVADGSFHELFETHPVLPGAGGPGRSRRVARRPPGVRV